MKTLIVHADDFNLTPGVSQGILQAYQEGIVRSTSVMANLPRLEDAAGLLRAHPGLDVGVHLNLTQGRPVSPAEKVPSLVDSNGKLRKRQQVDPARLVDAEVRHEFLEQVRSLQGLGVHVSHVDTHHHMHENDAIFPIVLDVAAAAGIAVRSYGDKMQEALRARGLDGPDNLIVEFYGEGVVTEDALLEILRRLPEGVSELCCHPAIVDEDLRAISSYTTPREQELDILRSPRIKAAIQEAGIVLAGYAAAFSR